MGDLHQKVEGLRSRLDRVKRKLRFDPYLDPEVGNEEQEGRRIILDRQIANELVNIVGGTIDLMAEWEAAPTKSESVGGEHTSIPTIVGSPGKITLRVVNNEIEEVEETSEEERTPVDDNPYSPSPPPYVESSRDEARLAEGTTWKRRTEVRRRLTWVEVPATRERSPQPPQLMKMINLQGTWEEYQDSEGVLRQEREQERVYPEEGGDSVEVDLDSVYWSSRSPMEEELARDLE